ncbi:hypothetical protein K1T71_003307 [Dendrolimus kikuchii]|uniref:Uncharacterized protein n=1 Tax=Dendrolimus kikuchii TaxID=765133 RepID=A0ACC1DCR4_9NEOP|nr:hypothetical protein K1T71_003307 [Dendrolimus kikuchii]
MVLTRSAHKRMIEATTEVRTEEVPRTTAVETNDDSGNLRTRSPGTNGHSSAHTVKSKGNKSVRSTSSSIAARKKRLQLEAAEAKARIQMELIDLKLAVNLKELDEADNCSLLSEGAIEHESEHCIVENWLTDNAQNQKMQTDLQPNGAMGPQVSAAPHVSTAAQDGMDGTVHALASALKDLAAATSAANSSGVNNRMFNRLCTAKELPLFSGDPLDWLYFKKAFEESSRICNFSEDENLWRLRKSLHGAAKDAVTALLISATSVETIMSSLELQFGNPDIIINRILQDIYKLRPISQEYQKDIIAFSIKIIKCKPSEPYLTRTLLGWCVHGCTRMPFKRGKSALQSALILSEESHPSSYESDRILQEMQEEMRHSFAIDAFGISSKSRQNREERQAIEQLESTAKLIDRRWFVGLPWKNTNIKMPDSYDNALIRLRGIEKKMKNNVGFATRYKERVDHLLLNDYASELDSIPNPKHVWYLPHFGVDNPNKQKLRLVFDAAAKCKGMSLNDFLIQGPDLLISLYGIMLRFRERKVAVTGDIKDMFLRVKIHKGDRDAFRFLWKEAADKPVKVFTMSSLIFGANCSPFIAQFVKNKNATRFAAMFPDAVNAIWKQHYMDDYIDSFDNEEIATKLVKDVTYVHQQGGFEIRNFTSNCKSVLCHLLDESLKPTAVTFKNGQQFCTGERTLGLIWFPSEDTLGFDVSFKKIPAPLMAGQKKPTKREMLRVIMSIFDIYGFLSPITIKGKIMLQDTWRSGITWDLEVADDIFTRWKEWLDLLRKVSTLRVPRYYALATKDSIQNESVTKNKSVQNERLENFSYRNLQLHIFCDASTRAMCAAAYWRWYNSNNEVQVSLIASKSRVAPVKYVSVPRLELQAALLASRLANSISPRDEILHTLMTEVEQMVNSRPLTHVTVEPTCEETLTPNHFILGSSSIMPMLGVFDNSDSYLRKQWRISQKLADMFWRRWLREVLPEMRPRTKWHQEQRPLQVGDFVLIVDPSTPRNVWPKGLIVTALPGKDGRTRVVDVKTQNGIFRRSAARLGRGHAAQRRSLEASAFCEALISCKEAAVRLRERGGHATDGYRRQSSVRKRRYAQNLLPGTSEAIGKVVNMPNWVSVRDSSSVQSAIVATWTPGFVLLSCQMQRRGPCTF